MGAINYDHHSAHSINLFCASTAMWVVEKMFGLTQPVGAPAHRGVAVEDGVTDGLMNPDSSLPECVKIAIVKYDTLMALSPDARREKYRETIEDMVRLALDELRPYGVPSRTTVFIGVAQRGNSPTSTGRSEFPQRSGLATASGLIGASRKRSEKQ